MICGLGTIVFTAFLVALLLIRPVLAGLMAALDGHGFILRQTLTNSSIAGAHLVLVFAVFQTFPIGSFALCAAVGVMTCRLTGYLVIFSIVAGEAIIIAPQEVGLALLVPAVLEIIAAFMVAVPKVGLTRVTRLAWIWNIKFARRVDRPSVRIVMGILRSVSIMRLGKRLNGNCLDSPSFTHHLCVVGCDGCASADLSLLLSEVFGVCDGFPNILCHRGGRYFAGYRCGCWYRDHDRLGSWLQLAARLANSQATRGIVLVPVANALD